MEPLERKWAVDGLILNMPKKKKIHITTGPLSPVDPFTAYIFKSFL